MPLFVAALWGALLQVVGTLVGRVLVSLGIGYATFSGVNTLLSYAKSLFLAGVNTMGANGVAIAGQMKVGVCVSMILSALVMRLTLNGLSAGGSITKMVQK